MKKRLQVLATVLGISLWCTLTLGRKPHYRHGAGPECSRCPPGYGVVRHCSAGKDTECAPCRNGTYSPHNSYRHQCFLCSRCGSGLYVAHPCIPTRDTICDSCHTYKGPHNDDFYVKCEVNASSFHPPTMEKDSFAERLVGSPAEHRMLSTKSGTESENIGWTDGAKNYTGRKGNSESVMELTPRPVSRAAEPQNYDMEYMALVAVVSVFACAIVIILLISLVGRICNRRHRKVRPQYPYQEVMTQEAVML